MGVRHRVGDKRVLGLVRASCGPGSSARTPSTGTRPPAHPKGGILSTLLANIALFVLDEHFTQKWKALGSEWKRSKHEALRDEVSAVLAPTGLRLSEEKTKVCHIDEGFDFLGFRIQRRLQRGTNKRRVYTYPSERSLASVMETVRALTRR